MEADCTAEIPPLGVASAAGVVAKVHFEEIAAPLPLEPLLAERPMKPFVDFGLNKEKLLTTHTWNQKNIKYQNGH